MNRPRPIAFAAAVGCLLLAGCGSGSAPTPGPTRSPATTSPSAVPGTPFSADTFTTVVPDAWNNKVNDSAEVQKFSANGRVEMLAEQGPPGQQQPNVNDVNAVINVIKLTTPVPDNQIPTYLGSVVNSGATNLSQPQNFTVDGATGQYITYDRDIQGTPDESQDMIVSHGGSTYDIVLVTSQYAFNEQRSGLDAVLAAWKWKS